MSKFDFKKDLLENVFCRLAPSSIHGVGVFAIRSIPKGINPMKEQRNSEFEEIKLVEITEDEKLSSEMTQLVKDMCPEHDGIFDIPHYSLNEIGISYYLNHSTAPNMKCDDDGNFYSLTHISVGEELTVDYGTYGALNL